MNFNHHNKTAPLMTIYAHIYREPHIQKLIYIKKMKVSIFFSIKYLRVSFFLRNFASSNLKKGWHERINRTESGAIINA